MKYPPWGQPPLVIKMAPPGQLARKVVKRSNARCTIKYSSWKMQSMLQCESTHERNCMLLLDVCPLVLGFHPQPCRIEFVLDRQSFMHYPDILVNTRFGQHLFEIKTARDAQDSFIRARSAFMMRTLPHHGFSYHLIVAEHLQTLLRLSDAETVKRLGNVHCSQLERERLRRLFAQHGSLSWQSVKHHLDRQLSRYVCRLILEGWITPPTSPDSGIYWTFDSIQAGGASWASLISADIR